MCKGFVLDQDAEGGMTEAERSKALKEVQLELFQLKQEYLLKRKALTRKFRLIQGRGMKRCRDCREEMDVEQFPLDPRYLDHRYPYCYECKLARVIKRKGNVKAGRAA